MLMIIISFCSYVEHKASQKTSNVFYLMLVLLPLSTFFQPSVVPGLLLFSGLLLVYPYSLYPDGSSPMCVFLWHLVVYVVYGQSNAIFFLLCCSIGVCFVPSHNSFEIFKNVRIPSIFWAHHFLLPLNTKSK